MASVAGRVARAMHGPVREDDVQRGPRGLKAIRHLKAGKELRFRRKIQCDNARFRMTRMLPWTSRPCGATTVAQTLTMCPSLVFHESSCGPPPSSAGPVRQQTLCPSLGRGNRKVAPAFGFEPPPSPCFASREWSTGPRRKSLFYKRPRDGRRPPPNVRVKSGRQCARRGWRAGRGRGVA